MTKLRSIDIRKPRCNQRSCCFRTSPHHQNSKDHAAHRRNWLPVPSENRTMSPPFLLRTDGQSLRICTCITVSRSSSKFGVSAAHRRYSVAFFFIMTMPVRTQQQLLLTFSMKSKCGCCRTHRIRQTFLPETSSYF